MSVSKDTIMKELKNLLIHNSIDEITKDDLEGIGIDLSKGTQKFGNIEISDSLRKITNLDKVDLMLMKKKSLQIYDENFSQKQVSSKFNFAFNIVKLIE